MAKALVGLLWIASLAAWTPVWSGSVASFVRWIAPLLAVAHVAEFFVFREVFVKAGGSMASHFVQTLLFGVFHIDPLKKRVGAG